MAFLERGVPPWALLTVTLLVSAGPTPAMAQEHRQSARILFREGNRLFSEGRFRAALEKFQHARRLYPQSRRIDLHIAYTLTELGWNAQAAEQLHQFLDKGGSRAEGKVITQVRARLEALKKTVGSVEITCVVAGAVVAVGGVVVGRTPLRHWIYRRVGTYVLTVDAAGHHPFSLSLTFAPGHHTRMEARLTPKKEETAVTEVPRYNPTALHKKWWLWTIVGAVVIGSAIAISASQTGGGETIPRGELGGISLE